MTAAAWWIVSGLLACGAEMLVPGVFLAPVGAAAVVAGLAVVLGAGGSAAWGVFVATMVILVLVAYRLRRGRPVTDVTNGPQAGLVGATCIADAFAGDEGRVRLGDGAWPARMADRTEPASVARLRVVAVEGTTLVVSNLVS